MPALISSSVWPFRWGVWKVSVSHAPPSELVSHAGCSKMPDVHEAFRSGSLEIAGGGPRPFRTALLCALVLVGCAASPPRTNTPVLREGSAKVAVPRTIVTPEAAASVPELYALASGLFDRAEYERAAREFDRIATLDPSGDLADDSLFRAGEAYDLASFLESAALRYEQLSQRYPESPLAALARVRATRLLVHLDRFERAGELARGILESGTLLNPFDRVLVYAASALWRLERGDELAAATFVEKGRSTIDAHRLDAAGRVGRELAALYYALGETRRRRAERITFEPMPPDYLDALERRCQLILDAQSAYSDTMRAYDAHWSAMAGFGVGELYRRLHEDLMQVRPPKSADTEEKRQLFEAGMRHRFAVLLEKALANVELTLGMLQRTQEKSSYLQRLTRARDEIVAAKDREQAALDRLPYSRATLEAALQELARRSEVSPGATPPPPPKAPSRPGSK